MKKKVLIGTVSIVLIMIGIISHFVFNNDYYSENKIVKSDDKDKQVINNNMITMMYEVEAGTGEYIEAADSAWPSSDYIFNSELSGCENGGELSWNDANKTVNLLSESSDRCYVYFDKYDGVWIDNVQATNITSSSITIKVTASSVNGNITNYYYALNDSEEYVSSTNNVIIIDDLSRLTEYEIKVYAVDNVGKRSNTYVLNVSTIDKAEPKVTNISQTGSTITSFTVKVDATSNTDIVKYYYSNDNGSSYVVDSNTHTFSGERNTEYPVSVFVVDAENNISQEYYFDAMTADNPSLANVCSNGANLASCIKTFYDTYGEGTYNLYLHDGNGTYGAYEAGDNSYRYSGYHTGSGENWVDNFICFGTTTSPCPEDNMYRIIGVFGNQVKLIKNRTLGNYYWSGTNNSSDTNVWSQSTLNTSTLNNTYLNSFSSTWRNKIATTSWKVGGVTGINETDSIKTLYNKELGNNSSSTTYSAKIGLVYASDYYYAVDSKFWSSLELGTDTTIEDWIYNMLMNNFETDGNGMYLWSISRNSGSTNKVFAFPSYMNNGGTLVNRVLNFIYFDVAVYPTFYLNSNVTYKSGQGTEANPYYIN